MLSWPRWHSVWVYRMKIMIESESDYRMQNMMESEGDHCMKIADEKWKWKCKWENLSRYTKCGIDGCGVWGWFRHRPNLKRNMGGQGLDWLLADFAFEAFGVVDASSCSHCFAFYLRPTLAAFLHVSLNICEEHYHDDHGYNADDHNGDDDDLFSTCHTSSCDDSYNISADDDVAAIYTRICMITM